MAISTSGTTLFSLDVDDIIEQATEYVKGDWSAGVEQDKARRALNLLLIELQNKRVPLHKIGIKSVPLKKDVSSYLLSNDVSDVLEITLKNLSTKEELKLTRESLKEYYLNVNKSLSQERPFVYTTERNADLVKVIFWPVPDTSDKYTAEILAIKRVEDVTASYQRIDLPYRYYPLLVAWLAYKLSLTREDVGEEVKIRLKNELTEIMEDTFDEDSERGDLIIIPGGISCT